MALQEPDRDNIFHERISILHDQGYRDFTVTKIKKKWDGVEVTVQNSSGQKITASGETNDEAYKKLIDRIDLLLDEPF